MLTAFALETAMHLVGCNIPNGECWDDYGGYDSTCNDDCDCEDDDFNLVPSDGMKPLEARPR